LAVTASLIDMHKAQTHKDKEALAELKEKLKEV
jgi:hypothetical protein